MSQQDKSSKLWGGRFAAEMADVALDISESTVADGRMVFEDIWGSQAHCIMLARTGIISVDDLREILRWLHKAKDAWDEGTFELKRELEDVHMNVEMYLREGAGPQMGGRLHTARSRNDQVATDGKMHCRARLLGIRGALVDLRQTLLDRAGGHEETVMPGYTHTQHAQPISIAFWLTGHASALARDDERLEQAYARTNTCPLGAAALAGTSFPTDRELSAKLLGFEGVQQHSLDCVGTRDWVAETIAALAILMAGLSKIAEEFVLWSTWEYRMLEIDDTYSSGSSIMPQKKNPCIAELTRGKVGIVYGRLMQIMTMLKALPSGYNRDLQEDKPPLWDALDCAEVCLRALTEMIRTVTFNTDQMRRAVSQNFATATELANFLVRERNLPFRTCHEIIGSLVGILVAENKTLDDHERVREVLADAGQVLSSEEIASVVDPVACLKLQVSQGSTGPEAVRTMHTALTDGVNTARTDLAEQMDHVQSAYAETLRIVEHVMAGGDLEDALPAE